MLSIIISLFGAYKYTLDTINGKTKPNRISWFLWAIAPLIGVGASLQGGGRSVVSSKDLYGWLYSATYIHSFFCK